MLTTHEKIVYAAILGGIELRLPYPPKEEVQALLCNPSLSYEQAARLLWKERCSLHVLREVKLFYEIFDHVEDLYILENVFPDVADLIKS